MISPPNVQSLVDTKRLRLLVSTPRVRYERKLAISRSAYLHSGAIDKIACEYPGLRGRLEKTCYISICIPVREKVSLLVSS